VNPVNLDTTATLDAAITHAVRRALSEPRLAPYLVAAGGDAARALDLYDWNSAMAAAAFGVLEVVEIAARNAFNDALSSTYGSAWWRPDNPPKILHGKCRDRAIEAMARLERAGAPLSTGKFVSEMSFGFWAMLTTRPYDRYWRAALHKAFAGKPPARRLVQQRMQRLNRLRNRIAHHEIIWSRDLCQDRDAAVALLHAFDPFLTDWTSRRFNRFDDELARRPCWVPAGTR
jgi:hypothetical protein